MSIIFGKSWRQSCVLDTIYNLLKQSENDENDENLTHLIKEMTTCDVNYVQKWPLNYIPPVHLRLKHYNYTL